MSRTTGKRATARWPWVVLAGVLAIAVALVFVAIGRGGFPGGPMTEPAQMRTVETVTRSTQRQTVTATGAFAPRDAAFLSFPAPGKVTSVKVKVGDRVEQDEVLATIDATELASAVTVAQAEVEAAQEQLDQAIDDKAGSATVAVARAGLESAQQSLRLARHNLASKTLRSPLDGVVAAVNITKGAQSGQGSQSGDPGGDPGGGMDPGMSGPDGGGLAGAPASAGDTASRAAAADVVVLRPGRWLVDITIGSSEVGLLKKGQVATVTPTGTSRALPATVRAVGVIGSSASGSVTFPATLTVRGKHDGIYIGGTAEVSITVKEHPDILTVPTVAIEQVDGETTVTAVVGGTDQQVPVKLGETFGNRTQILDGLREGDQIAYSGPAER